MSDANLRDALLFHLAVIAVLFALQFVLPAYHHTELRPHHGVGLLRHRLQSPRRLHGPDEPRACHVLRCRALRRGIDDPLFRSAGIRGFLLGVLSGTVLAIAVGLVALRTSGVSFMIVTMMLAQACYLATLYFNDFTRGDEGFVLRPEARRGVFVGLSFDLSDPAIRYQFGPAAVCSLPVWRARPGALGVRPRAGGGARERGSHAAAGL